QLGQGIDLALRPRPRERGTVGDLRAALAAALSGVSDDPRAVTAGRDAAGERSRVDASGELLDWEVEPTAVAIARGREPYPYSEDRVRTTAWGLLRGPPVPLLSRLLTAVATAGLV